MKFLHCSECGSAYADTTRFPRYCACGTIKWANPTPVAAVMQPVITDKGIGLVIAKRAIQPMKGHWSLIGGFMEVGETVEEAAEREFREETSLEVQSTPRIVFTAPVGHDGSQLMLMTCVDKYMPFEVFEQGTPCSENEELGVLHSFDELELAFPTHQEAVRRYFSGEFECHR